MIARLDSVGLLVRLLKYALGLAQPNSRNQGQQRYIMDYMRESTRAVELYNAAFALETARNQVPRTLR